jgi:hypothetical protein
VERETGACEYNWATIFLGDINEGSGLLGWRSFESETVKYDHVSRRNRIKE